MAKHETILAFDTSAPHCAAALLKSGSLTARAEPMKRGQSERLFPFLEELLASQNCAWADLDKIAVGIGPGNFTGIRIAIASARGLSLSLGIPAIGVSTFEAARFGAAGDAPVALPAPQARVYFSETGNDATLLSENEGVDGLGPPEPEELVRRIAQISSTRKGGALPAPLYLRPADAAPSSDPPPRILNGPDQ